MTDTIDELVKQKRDQIRAMTEEEIAAMEVHARAHNAPWGDLHNTGQAYMNNTYRQMLDAMDGPRKLTKWQRFVLWIKG